jgi:hypothetical protein
MEPSTQDDARAPDTAAQSTRHSLALKEAIDQGQQLLDDQTRVLGPDRQETLRTRGNVAVFLAQSGQIEAAVSRLRPLLDDLIRCLVPTTPMFSAPGATWLST